MNLKVREDSKNYACSVVEIKNLFPIEGADKIQRCVVNGNDVVVSKNVQLGDKMLYFVSGTKLNQDYCSKNNLLDKSEMNKDITQRGFISSKQFRVKAIKLKGVISDGMLMPMKSLLPFLEWTSIDNLKVGNEFTDINGNTLCEKYFVPVRNSNPGGKAPKQPKNTRRLLDNQFYLHNDTHNLHKNIENVNLSHIIGLHYKKHGTSAVFGNVLVKKNLKWYEKLAEKLGINIIDTEYDLVYSSRKVIKNAYLNQNNSNSYYSEDIWKIVANEIKDLIPKNWTLYGEILGFLPDGKAIQAMNGKAFDYNCEVGEHKFYVYKISVVNPDGKVIYLTDKQIGQYCEKVGLLYKDTFEYYGLVSDFLIKNEIEYTQYNWREKFIEFLVGKYNEKDCRMCLNKVPEEGIVLRIERLEAYEAYKLKSKRFILGESEAQEKGEENLEDSE